LHPGHRVGHLISQLFVVRWVRTDGRDVKQKFYRRRHDADSFAARLASYGKPVTVYATAATRTETERTSR